MTYAELLALINPANAVTRTDNYSAMGDTPGYSTTTAVPDWYYADPNNPIGGAVQDLGGGALSYWMPRDTMSGDDDQVFDLSRSRVRYFIEPEASTATHSTRMNLGESRERTDGGAGSCYYIFEGTDGSETGWVAK